MPLIASELEKSNSTSRTRLTGSPSFTSLYVHTYCICLRTYFDDSSKLSYIEDEEEDTPNAVKFPPPDGGSLLNYC